MSDRQILVIGGVVLLSVGTVSDSIMCTFIGFLMLMLGIAGML